jgi:hypothetical protein
MHPFLIDLIDPKAFATIFLTTLAVGAVVVFLVWVAFRLRKANLSLRKLALPLLLLLFLASYPLSQPFIHWLADMLYGAAGKTDALGNIEGAQVAADQVASGAVPLGAVYTKLWIATLFFTAANIQPWIAQQATHPGPTAWAKSDYTGDFRSRLTVKEKFEAYGRLQLNLTIKFAASILAACLIQ